MRRAYKFRLLPNKEQASFIDKTIGCSRLVYNLLLENYKEQLGNKEKPKLREVTFFKNQGDYSYLKEVDSLALANAKRNLENSLTNFYKSRSGLRKGMRMGFPKFHSKHRNKWRYTTNNQENTIRIVENRIRLPKIGYIKLIQHREVLGRITSCTIEKTRDNNYYISILSEIPDNFKKKENLSKKSVNELRKNLKVVGIDMSLSSFSIDSSDTKTKYTRLYRKNEKKKSKLQRRLSRTKKDSSGREKARIKLAKLDRHIANSRLDYCHKLSRYYAKNYDIIVLEDINLQGMSRGGYHLGKSIYDMGFGMFRSFLSYKCKEEDSLIMYVPRYFPSSKMCHECGTINSLLKLSDREWVCTECGSILDRDKNASLNLRDYFYNVLGNIEINTVGTTGINASGEETSTLRFTLMQVASLKEETPSFRWE